MGRKTSTTMNTAASSKARLRREEPGSVFDLLDPSMAKNIQYNQADDDYETDFSSDDDDEPMEFDEKGRLIIPGDESSDDEEEEEEEDDDAKTENEQIKQGAKRQR